MKSRRFNILNESVNIPAVLWGNDSDRLFIEVHGNLSHKEDSVIRLFAGEAVKKGCGVLSFDLPRHGDRKEDEYECNPQNCISDLSAVYRHACDTAKEVSLFACSMGAYFSLLAYREAPLDQCLFLSPVVNMLSIIQSMMRGFNVTEERLQKEKKIPLPSGQELDWNYYNYVKSNPVNFRWTKPTGILYGAGDDIVKPGDINSFAAGNGAELEILGDGEHFFHTDEQLEYFRRWVEKSLMSSQGLKTPSR